MSKCDMRIEFDQADRTFRGGDVISGTVSVTANADCECRKLVISRLWQTHGRGNVASGDADEVIVFSGLWKAGQREQYRFEFECPASPLTYHGHFINIDHYIKAQADIPWAFDPKASEEFVVLTGGVGGSSEASTLGSVGSHDGDKGSGCLIIIGVIAILIGLLFIFPVGIFSIPIGLFMIARGLWKTIAEQRLGNVTASVKPAVLHPSDEAAAEIRIDPDKDVSINGINVKLICRERCISGSGSNRTTHKHTVHTQEVRLTDATVLRGGSSSTFQAKLPIPADAPYSFSARDNHIEWEATFKIDIPRWPDWNDSRMLVVRPEATEVVGATPAHDDTPIEVSETPQPQQPVAPPPPPLPPKKTEPLASPTDMTAAVPAPPSLPESDAELPSAIDIDKAIPKPDIAEEAPLRTHPARQPEQADEPPARETPEVADAIPETTAAEPPDTPDAASEPEAAPAGDSVESAIRAVREASRFGSERQQMIDQLISQHCDLEIEVKRTSWTFGADGPHRDGRTVVGVIAGTDLPIGARFVKDRNEEIDALKSGDKVRAAGRIVEWSTLHDQPEIAAE